jgi:hypothetical protein
MTIIVSNEIVSIVQEVRIPRLRSTGAGKEAQGNFGLRKSQLQAVDFCKTLCEDAQRL